MEDKEGNGLLRGDFQEDNHASSTFRTNNMNEGNKKTAGFWGYAMQIIYQVSLLAYLLLL